jgi:GNAT superfamily N-acetyltransferase
MWSHGWPGGGGRKSGVGMNYVQVMEAYARLRAGLADLHLQLDEGADFGRALELVNEMGRAGLTEHFSPDLNTYTPPVAFWLRAVDGGGATVAFAAARLDDLGPMTLVDYWRAYWRRCYPAASGRCELAADQPAFSAAVTGRVVYLGEMWVHPDWRGRGLASLFAPAIQLLALARWEPDWLYVWMRPSLYRSGFDNLTCAFSRVYPRGIHWRTPPATIDDDLCVAMNSRADALYWMELIAAGLHGKSSST